MADPAGGSYYIEALTDSLAREAWKLFQQVEAEGGYAKALASGSIAKALAETRAAREKAVSSRRRALVGVNNYPEPDGEDVRGEFRRATRRARFPPSAWPSLREDPPAHRPARRATGRYPRVLLLKRGDVKMRGARAPISA